MQQALGAAARILPFLAHSSCSEGAGARAFIARRWGFPLRGPGGILAPLDAYLTEVYTRFSNEDYSAFGPLGIVALAAAASLAVWAYVRRRAGDGRQKARARLRPAALSALRSARIDLGRRPDPLLPRPCRTYGTAARVSLPRAGNDRTYVVAAITVGLTITQDIAQTAQWSFRTPGT